MWIRSLKELNRFLDVGEKQLELENGYNIVDKLNTHNIYIVITNSGKAKILSYEAK